MVKACFILLTPTGPSRYLVFDLWFHMVSYSVHTQNNYEHILWLEHYGWSKMVNSIFHSFLVIEYNSIIVIIIIKNIMVEQFLNGNLKNNLRLTSIRTKMSSLNLKSLKQQQQHRSVCIHF